MSEKLSMVLFSGTVDKVMAATIMATGAAAMGKEVTIFLTFWGLMAFRKDDWKTNMRLSADFADFGPMVGKAMQEKQVPSWRKTLDDAMEIGQIKIVACGMTMDLFELKLSDLEPVVSDVIGVAGFMQESEGAQLMFI